MAEMIWLGDGPDDPDGAWVRLSRGGKPSEPGLEQLRAWYVNGSIDLAEYEERVARRLAQEDTR